MEIKWKAVIRDVIIIWILTFLGGYVVAVATAPSSPNLNAVAISNLIFLIVGFTISGCIEKVKRFNHLSIVALAVWLAGLFNVLFLDKSMIDWLSGILAIAITMLIGGLISFIFVRSPKEQ